VRFNWEAVQNAWNQWVLSYSQERQQALADLLGLAPTLESIALVLAAVIGVLLAVMAALSLRSRAVRDPLGDAYRQLRDKLDRAGVTTRRRASSTRELCALNATMPRRVHAPVALQRTATRAPKAASCRCPRCAARFASRPAAAERNQTGSSGGLLAVLHTAFQAVAGLKRASAVSRAQRSPAADRRTGLVSRIRAGACRALDRRHPLFIQRRAPDAAAGAFRSTQLAGIS
jgi:hypothetical protein